MPSDLDTLVEMGFDKDRSELAVKKTGGLQGALQWLEDNQDESLEDIKASEAAKAAEAEEDEDETTARIAELESGAAPARSLVCNECGKRFRNKDLASYHASKTEHADFSESTEEIAPLTQDEKTAKLDELRERLKAKRAVQADKDKEEHKRNEQIRMKSTKESQTAKEELERKEQIKEAARKRKEKTEDLDAKKRIKAIIEADKAERRRKAEEAKAAREGKVPEAAAPAAAAAPPKPKVEQNEVEVKLRTPTGEIIKTLPVQTTLAEIAKLVEAETGAIVTSFTTPYPRKTYKGDELSQTLSEANLGRKPALIVG